MTVTWVTRDQAGLVPPNPNRLSLRDPADKIVGITKHHTGSTAPRTKADSLRIWRNLQAEAMSGNNVNHTYYGDIEYNAGFDDFGQVLAGRGNQYVGAHAKSSANIANRITLGVAYIGIGDPSPLALDALRAYFFVVSFGIIRARAIGVPHSVWAGVGGIVTDCPGNLLRNSNP